VSPWRAALVGGLIYSTAYGLWLIGGLQAGPQPPDLAPAYRALLRLQVLAPLLLLPALGPPRAAPLDALGAALLLSILPWPLLPLFRLTGSMELPAMVLSQAAVAAWALAVMALWLAARRLTGTAPVLIQGAALLLAIWGLPVAVRGLIQ
jgi:hypothetical protein